jgi:hypothetical protein
MRLLRSVMVGLMATEVAFVIVLMLWVLIGEASIWWENNGGGGVGAFALSLEVPVLIGVAVGITASTWQWKRG